MRLLIISASCGSHSSGVVEHDRHSERALATEEATKCTTNGVSNFMSTAKAGSHDEVIS